MEAARKRIAELEAQVADLQLKVREGKTALDAVVSQAASKEQHLATLRKEISDVYTAEIAATRKRAEEMQQKIALLTSPTN